MDLCGDRKLKIMLNDFGGYAFPAQLSQSLARQGHEVLHTYCASLQTTPAGCAHVSSSVSNLRFEPIRLQKPLQKYSFVKRFMQEREYGQKAASILASFKPDCVLSANTPLDAQKALWKCANKLNIAKVFWLQDVLGVATKKILSRKLSLPGAMIGSYYESLERTLLSDSEHIIVISDAFKQLLKDWMIPEQRSTVIENWAPLDELAVLPRNNEWSKARGLDDKVVFLYSGTLSLKHDPSLLFEAARKLQGHNALMIVRSQGQGASWLTARLAEEPLSSLRVEPFGAYNELQFALASADVLIAILEPDAAVYSVPSKVLTYMCAQRALLLSVPLENHAAKVVMREEAGLVNTPDDVKAFVSNALRFINDPMLRQRCAENARRYATRAFDIDAIAEKFERLLGEASASSARSSGGAKR